MIEQRKKDYLQRIIEEFFIKLQELTNKSKSKAEMQLLLTDCFKFYVQNFGVKRDDTVSKLIEKIKEPELIEGYAKFLLMEYQNLDIKYKDNLNTSLELIESLELSDSTYSWDRITTREDILRLLEDSSKKY